MLTHQIKAVEPHLKKGLINHMKKSNLTKQKERFASLGIDLTKYQKPNAFNKNFIRFGKGADNEDVVFILLQNGEECIVDQTDYYRHQLGRYYWSKDHTDPSRGYVSCWIETSPSDGKTNNKRHILIQYIIKDVTFGADGEYVIDHINHNHLDNRLSNLRKATKCANARNRTNGKGALI